MTLNKSAAVSDVVSFFPVYCVWILLISSIKYESDSKLTITLNNAKVMAVKTFVQLFPSVRATIWSWLRSMIREKSWFLVANNLLRSLLFILMESSTVKRHDHLSFHWFFVLVMSWMVVWVGLIINFSFWSIDCVNRHRQYPKQVKKERWSFYGRYSAWYWHWSCRLRWFVETRVLFEFDSLSSIDWLSVRLKGRARLICIKCTHSFSRK